MSAQAGASAYALLTDGTTVEIRPARPDDFEAVRDMHAKMSAENLYRRFFGTSQLAAEQEARRICREPGPDRAALLAVLEGQVVECGSYELAGDGSRSAEIAMAVADDMHSRGIGTLLLEHLVSLARGRGVRGFEAETLGDKDHVSGNDMLLWWKSDEATRLAVLCLDSFGNPRKFARTARAVGRAMPVLAVNVGRSVAGRRLARARAEAATPLTRQALFAGWPDRHGQSGRTAGHGGDAGNTAGARWKQGRRGGQHPRWRDARCRRVRRRGPAGRHPG